MTAPNVARRSFLAVLGGAAGSEGVRYAYTNCLITRVVFPHLDAAGTGNLYEEVTLKPERLELK